MGQYKWTERQIREGRGQGIGEHYLPWIHVRDFSSKGKASRFKSWKSGRTIQCFSDIETAFAYLLEWSDTVVDYYEQFPLLPLEETVDPPVTGQKQGDRVRHGHAGAPGWTGHELAPRIWTQGTRWG